jgi:hypothetical protein
MGGQLVGRVVAYLSDDFFFTEALKVDTEVLAEPEEGMTWVSVDSVEGVYSLPGARLARSTLVAVRAPDSDYLLTLSNQDTQDGRTDIGVVPRAVVDDVFSTLLVPTEIDESLAQLAVRLVSEDGQSVSGASLEVPGAEFTSYADAGSWTELGTTTGSSGLVFAGNVEGADFPGRLADLIVTSPSGTTTRITVPLARAAITVFSAIVPL